MRHPVFTHGGKIAIKPPEATGIKVKVNNAFATVEQKTVLAEVEVVFASYDNSDNGRLCVEPGDTLLVNSSSLMVQAMNVQKLHDKEFVMIDASIVYVVVKGTH